MKLLLVVALVALLCLTRLAEGAIIPPQKDNTLIQKSKDCLLATEQTDIDNGLLQYFEPNCRVGLAGCRSIIKGLGGCRQCRADESIKAGKGIDVCPTVPVEDDTTGRLAASGVLVASFSSIFFVWFMRKRGAKRHETRAKQRHSKRIANPIDSGHEIKLPAGPIYPRLSAK